MRISLLTLALILTACDAESADSAPPVPEATKPAAGTPVTVDPVGQPVEEDYDEPDDPPVAERVANEEPLDPDEDEEKPAPPEFEDEDEDEVEVEDPDAG